MVSWPRPFIEQADGPIVAWRGKAVAKIAGAVQTARDCAGFGFDVTAYSIRHSVATHLRAHGVPRPQISELLGHEMPGSRTTVRYQHRDPKWMSDARKALEKIGAEIGISANAPRASSPKPKR
jgi:integrase